MHRSFTSARFAGTQPALVACVIRSCRRRECFLGRLWPKVKWRYVHCRCHDFRFYVTLFPKCFSNFRSHYLFAIGLPTLYLTLADTYLPIHTALPSSATRLMDSNEALWFLAHRANTELGLNTHKRGCIQQWVCFAHWNFASPAPSIGDPFVPQLKAVDARFGIEFVPSSLAAD